VSKKGYDHQYFFAEKPMSISMGSMICEHCKQKIDPETKDWKSCQKTTIDGDWRYVCHHRECFKGHDGWAVIESQQSKWQKRLDSMRGLMGTAKNKDPAAFEFIVEELAGFHDDD
jgi:hypothetical protein